MNRPQRAACGAARSGDRGPAEGRRGSLAEVLRRRQRERQHGQPVKPFQGLTLSLADSILSGCCDPGGSWWFVAAVAVVVVAAVVQRSAGRRRCEDHELPEHVVQGARPIRDVCGTWNRTGSSALKRKEKYQSKHIQKHYIHLCDVMNSVTSYNVRITR